MVAVTPKMVVFHLRHLERCEGSYVVNAERTWLSLLNGATNYSELQNAFELMSVDAQSTDDSEAMIASIDEAIRRIERERARDQNRTRWFRGRLRIL